LSIPLDAYQQYVPLTPEQQQQKLRKIGLFIINYANESPVVDLCDIAARKGAWLDIIEKVEKRRVYFRVFHGITMSEQNEISLYCFWALKEAPLFNRKNPDHRINTAFAFYMFVEMIHRVRRKMGLGDVLSGKYANNLIYAFQNRDLSKEAIMLIAESLLVA
jgi:hypothetical protein